MYGVANFEMERLKKDKKVPYIILLKSNSFSLPLQISTLTIV